MNLNTLRAIMRYRNGKRLGLYWPYLPNATQCASVVVMSTDLGTTNPCSLPVGAPGILFSSQLFSNSLIIHEADISARRVQRVNPPSDTCITAECDVTVMEDSGTQTSSDPHFPIVPSSASVHVQHGVHESDNVLRSELNNIISKLKSEIRMETQVRMLSLEALVAELKQSVNNLIKKCRELLQAQPSSKTSTHSHSPLTMSLPGVIRMHSHSV